MIDNVSSFIGGALISMIGAVHIWLTPMQINTGSIAGDIAMNFAVKVIGTIILGLVGGLTGLATKDFYLIIKKRFKK